MQKSTRNEIVKFLFKLLFGSTFIFGTGYFLNKGCSHLSGADEKHDYQIEQIQLIGMPENTILVYKDSLNPSSAKVATHLVYKTSLSTTKVVDYYKHKLSLNGWKGGELYSEVGVGKNLRLWSKNGHAFRLRFEEKKKKEERYEYMTYISWRR